MKYIVALLCIYFVNSVTYEGVYENLVNKKIVYSQLGDNEKMIGFPWADFEITSGEIVQKVMVFISTNKTFLGEWQGAFGTSTTIPPDYWYMTSDMSIPFTSKKGKIAWNVDNSTAEFLNLKHGELKFGVWYIDCDKFTIDKIVVFTDVYEGGYEDDKEDTGNKEAVKIAKGTYEAEIGDKYITKELEEKVLIPINWNRFTIPKNETIKKIKITLSTTDDELGNWEGIFGSATAIAPDYWVQTKQMKIFLSGTTNSVTWGLTADEAAAVQSQTKGQLKFGVFSIDCESFTIDTCTIYTDAASDGKGKENKDDDDSLSPVQKFGIAVLIILGIFLLLFIICMIRRYIKLNKPNEIE